MRPLVGEAGGPGDGAERARGGLSGGRTPRRSREGRGREVPRRTRPPTAGLRPKKSRRRAPARPVAHAPAKRSRPRAQFWARLQMCASYGSLRQHPSACSPRRPFRHPHACLQRGCLRRRRRGRGARRRRVRECGRGQGAGHLVVLAAPRLPGARALVGLRCICVCVCVCVCVCICTCICICICICTCTYIYIYIYIYMQYMYLYLVYVYVPNGRVPL